MRPFLRHLLFVGLFGLLAPSALAQSGNVKTVEGPRGERMTLTAQPHQVAEGLSVRAMGIDGPNGTRWALSLIGAAPDDSIALQYGDQLLSVERVSRPDDGIGPTKVYVRREDFLTMAETSTVTLIVGDVSAALPEALRREMRRIIEEVT
jgi:hypothetical protein